jgi:hypothetical protein
MDIALAKRWKTIEANLNRVCAALPSPEPTDRPKFEASIAQFREYISHNEFELAFDALFAAADLARCRGGVWRDLERTAEFMGLSGRASLSRERFLAARVGEEPVPGNPKRGKDHD